MTPQERDLAIRTMLAEAGSQGPAGQAAVAEVILNRAKSGRYGQGVGGVVLAKNQFEPWNPNSGNDPRRFDANSREYKEAGDVLDGVAGGLFKPLTGGATHFVAPGAQKALGRNMPSWAKQPIRALGGHTFYSPEGKSMYDPSDWDAISRSSSPTGVKAPGGVPQFNTTPPGGGAPAPMQLPSAPSPAPAMPQIGGGAGASPFGGMKQPPQSWGDVFGGASRESPLLFRALSYGLQPSNPAGGQGASASGGVGGAPSAPGPAAGNPAAAPAGGGFQLPGLLGMLQSGLSGLGGGSGPMQLPGAAGGAAGGMGGGLMGMLGNLFKAI